MAYTIEFLRTAHEELTSLPKGAQRQIIKRVDALKNDPRPAGAEQLQGAEKFLRMRVADYRVIYTVEGRQLRVLIVRGGHRKEVYETLKSSASRLSIGRQRKK